MEDTVPDPGKQPARRLAPASVGFLFAGLYVAAAVVEAAPGARQWGRPLWAFIAAFVYWLVCVYRINSAIRGAIGPRHPIIPSQSVTFQFVPIFNIYWIFRWTNAVGVFLRQQGETYVNGEGGLCLLLAFGAGRIDPLVGLLALFAYTAWLSQRVRKALTRPIQHAYLAA